MPRVKESLQYLLLDPIEKRSPALMPLRLSQILHDRTRGRSDAYFRRLGMMLKPRVSLPLSRQMDNAATATSLAALRRRGWDILPWRLNDADITELRSFAFSTPAYAVDPSERININSSNIPNDYGRYDWRISDLIRVPAIQSLVADSALHSLAQDYIGCRPLLTSMMLWLSPVYTREIFDAHIYHYDNDGPAFLKYFVHITDVDVDSGAHSFIQGSHSQNKPAHLWRSQRYDREELLNYYGSENEIIFSAPAGTILAEDTSGFHKGTTLRNDYRLMLQLQYAILDIPHIDESAGIERVHIEGLDPGIRRICRKFFC